jgi:L-ascorbate metabolism protein UlaG (beta-lactamase superfamily)
MGIDPALLTEITPGETVRVGDLAVTGVPARHAVAGYIAEDAVGYVVDSGSARVYHSGDTDYDRLLLDAGGHGPLNVALVCVNATGGNMNPTEAAALVSQLRPTTAVPMHWGMWLDDTDPAVFPTEFADVYGRLCPGAKVRIPELGVVWEVSA